jgi:hypothetical protein
LEEIIHKIIAADISAQKKLLDAEENERQALKQANLDKSRIEEDVWNAAKRFVEVEKQRLEKLLLHARDEQNDRYAASLISLEENFAQQRARWRKELYDHCLNQE